MLRIPAATYRIQFSLAFRFVDGRDLVPYLDDLGITDLYSSPRFKARRGSPHAYDVADPYQINSELGTDEEFRDLAQKLRHYGMGLLLDIVPNHMAVTHENPWWADVLENGITSRYARFFDIDWGRVGTKSTGKNCVLVPVLGDLYGRVLENQELNLRVDENGFFIRYYDHRFPLDPSCFSVVLGHALPSLRERIAPGHPALEEFPQLLDAVLHLPPHNERDPAKIERRHRDAKNIKRLLWRLYHKYPETKDAIDESIRVINGTKGDPASFDLLDSLLSRQAYRLAYWRLAAEEIVYRRFFDISDLISLRVEIPEVFEARHLPIIELVENGVVTGLRVDHVDGLHDPLQYLARLQTHAAPAIKAAAGASAGNSQAQMTAGQDAGFYIIAEKILGSDELLPEDWPVYGTTGYDFLNSLNGIFVDSEGLKKLDKIYSDFIGDKTSAADLRLSRKRMVVQELFGGEVGALSLHLGRLAAQDRYARDLSYSELVRALVEITAALPIYRTYIRDFQVSERDREFIEQALSLAAHSAGESVSPEVFAFLRRLLLLEIPHYVQDRAEWLRFVMRWQQFSGPVMAKGYEDTASYIYNRLVSQNEVGSDPQSLDAPAGVEAFHQRNQNRARRWRHSLNATSTHDTKRSEDVRARISVLSEIPDEWAEHAARWKAWNASKKQLVNGVPAPDANDEFFLYQTLLGAWPLCEEDKPAFNDRIKNYLQKAARESKVHTSWTRIDEAYENALLAFSDAILEETEENQFLRDFEELVKSVAYYGAANGLSQVLLKITSPGVPDFYQGTELWDFSLVDPDNRRSVDFARRAALLDELKSREAEDPLKLALELVRFWSDGRIKLYLTYKALNFRRANHHVFRDGDYVPLKAHGERERNVCAFARSHEGEWAITVAPLLTHSLGNSEGRLLGEKGWGDTSLPLPAGAPQEWHNALTGEKIRTTAAQGFQLSSVLHAFPVALLAGT